MAKKSSRHFSFAGKNIKKIRQAKNISQSDFANLLNLSRPSIGAYEEGRSEPKIETLIGISRHFKISIDIMLTRELTSADIFSLGIVNKKLDKAHNLDPSSPTYRLVPFVGINDYVNLLVKHQKKDFPKSLPSVALPPWDQESIIAFELEGNEMEYDNQGLHHGDIVFCKAVKPESLSTVHSKRVFTIMTADFIKTRRMGAITGSNISLVADNPAYNAIDLPKDRLIQLWEVNSRYTRHFKSPSGVEKRLSLIEEKLNKMGLSSD